MGKLLVYSVFHGNLNFSRVPSELHHQILRDCYWPLLRKIEESNIQTGVEMSGWSLKMLNQMDPAFTNELKALWEAGLCEFIGCGYIQSVMPLIPANVNKENLRIGNLVYQELLGSQPSLAFVNEQVYSSSLPRLYKEAGYQGLIVNWDSSRTAIENPSLWMRPCKIQSDDGSTLPVLWHSQETSRYLQQYVFDDLPLETLVQRVMRYKPQDSISTYPLYTSDWDIFDFKPWASVPDGFESPYGAEFDRIGHLFSALSNIDGVEFLTPSNVIKHFEELSLVSLHDAEFPITYKKQSEHSMARWSVCGRDSVLMNTQCYELYQLLELLSGEESLNDLGLNQTEQIRALWEDLCFLWGSDFRTFTTDEKYIQFRNKMGTSLEKARGLLSILRKTNVVSGVNKECLKNYNEVSIIARHQPECQIDESLGVITTPSVGIQLDADKSGNIRYLSFPNITDIPVINSESTNNRYSEDLIDRAMGGSVQIEDWNGRVINGRVPSRIQYPTNTSESTDFLSVRCVTENDIGTIWKTFKIYRERARVDCEYRFQWADLVPRYFRIYMLSANPEFFDAPSLYYATTNGSNSCERFSLKGHSVKHDEILDPQNTSTCCIGATEGWVVLGDDTKGIGFVTKPYELYSAAMIRYQEQDPDQFKFNMNLVYSLGEHDDTSHILWRGHSLWNVSIIGGGSDIIDSTRALALKCARKFFKEG